MNGHGLLWVACLCVTVACVGGEDTSPDDSGSENEVPVANAGVDHSANKGGLVTLDGSESSDADGDDLTYAWSQVSGAAVTLSDATIARPSFIAPSVEGDVVLSVVVGDGEDTSAPDSVVVTVINRLPSANAGPDQAADEGEEVTLDGSASSDPDADELTWAWTQTSGTAVTLSSSTATRPTFTAPSVGGPLQFGLVVTDADAGASAQDVVTITVMLPPVANAGEDASASRGDTVALDGTASDDPDGVALTYAWTQVSGAPVSLSNPTSSGPTFTAPNTLGDLVFGLVVTDEWGTPSGQDTVTITVVNEVPVADAGDDANAVRGGSVTLDGTGSDDADGVSLTYAWTQISGTAVTLSSATASQPTFTAPSGLGSLVFGLVVTDADSAPSTQDQVTITVANAVPVANAGADDTAYRGDAVTLDGTASDDPDGVALTYAWTQVSGEPVALTGGTTAEPSFTAPGVLGPLVFRLIVTDGDGTPSILDTVTITVANRAPVADAGDDGSVYKAVTVILDGSESYDPDDDGLTYAWTQVSGTAVTLSSATAEKPTFTSPTTVQNLVFQLVVTDEHAGVSDPDQVTLTIENQPPTADAGSGESVHRGDPVTLDGTGSSDPDGATLTYAWTQVSGTTVTLSSASASQPTFTAPAVFEELVFGLVVTDVDGAPSSQDTVTIEVENEAPTAYAGADDTAYKGDTVTLDGTGSSDGGGDDLTYAWTHITDGKSLILSDETAAQPTFTAPDLVGDLVFGLVVTDEHDASSTQDTVTISVENRAPTAHAGADDNVVRDVVVTLDGTGSFDPDDDAITYEWSQVSGTAVELSDTTAASPEFTSPTTLGALVFGLVVTDDDGAGSLEDTVTITVENGLPVADAGEDASKHVLETVSLDGTGSTDDEPGALTYAWEQVSGPTTTLVDDDTATPSFEAAPFVASYVFELTVTDGDGEDDTDTVTITLINDPPEASAVQFGANGGELVWLDATGSNDPEEGRLSYRWRQTSGTAVGMAEPSSPLVPIVLPDGQDWEELIFEVTVDDGENTDTAEAIIAVTPYGGETIWAGGADDPFAEQNLVDVGISIGDTTLAVRLFDTLHVLDAASGEILASSAAGAATKPLFTHGGQVVVTGDISGSAFDVWSPDPQDPSTLVKVTIGIGTLIWDVALTPDGTTVFAAVSNAPPYLVVAYDLTDPSDPSLYGNISFGTSFIWSMSADETRLFVVSSTASFPTKLSTVVPPTPQNPAWGAPLHLDAPCDNPIVREGMGDRLTDVYVHGDVLYGACEQGLVVFDIATPDVNPDPVATLPTARGRRVHAYGDTLVIGGSALGVYQVDVSDPTAPVLEGVHSGRRLIEYPRAVQVYEDSDGVRTVYWRTSALDTWESPADTPSFPLPLGQIDGVDPRNIGVGAGLLLAGDDPGFGTDVYDVRDPTATELLLSTALEPNRSDGYAVRSPLSFLVGSNYSIDEVDVFDGATQMLVNFVPVFRGFDHLRVIAGDHAVATHADGMSRLDLDAPVGSNWTDLYASIAGHGLALDGTSVWGSFADTWMRSVDLTWSEPPLAPGWAFDAELQVNDLVSVGHGLVGPFSDGNWQIWPDYTAPRVLRQLETTGDQRDITGTGALVLAAVGGGVGAWDMTDPLVPRRVAWFATTGWTDRIVTDAGILWSVDRDADRLEAHDLRAARLTPTTDEVPISVENTFWVQWDETLPDVIVCETTTGGVFDSITPTDGFATLVWHSDQFGPHEIACVVGDAQSHVIVRERVEVIDPG